jgi:hypothetical protein
MNQEKITRHDEAMDRFPARKHSAGSNPMSLKMSCASGMTGWIVALATLLILLLPGHGFTAERSFVPSPRWFSQVKYDPNLKNCKEKCYFNSEIKKRVRSCEAKLINPDTIELTFHNPGPACHEWLKCLITKGIFGCCYKVNCEGPREISTSTTKREKLTLDKRVYQKGDLIKGRIDVEVLNEPINPKYANSGPRTITVRGIFETIVK